MDMNIHQEIPNDELTKRIAHRLGERQNKIQSMAEWNRPARNFTLPQTITLLSVAACFALLFMIAPWQVKTPVDLLGITPNLTEFRSAQPNINEIQTLLEKSEYEEALLKTEQLMVLFNSEIDEIEKLSVIDEVAEYEKQMLCTMNSELCWTYIYLLVKTGRNEKALQYIEYYINDAKYAFHIEDAIALRDAIKNEKK